MSLIAQSCQVFDSSIYYSVLYYSHFSFSCTTPLLFYNDPNIPLHVPSQPSASCVHAVRAAGVVVVAEHHWHRPMAASPAAVVLF